MSTEQLQDKAAEYGTDDQYQAWIRRQRSCISGRFCEQVHGEGRNPSCHVRRASNSGTGIKPLYSSIPLTHEEHNMQHIKGEMAVLLHYGIMNIDNEGDAKWWFDSQLKRHLIMWLATFGWTP